MVKLLRQLPWQRLIKFAFVGGTAFALDFGIYFILTRFAHIPYISSRVLSIAAAFTWNFMLNRNWTFQAKTGRVGRQAARFVIVMVGTSMLNLVLLRFGVESLHSNDLIVLVVVSLMIMGVNFLLHSLWSYRQ